MLSSFWDSLLNNFGKKKSFPIIFKAQLNQSFTTNKFGFNAAIKITFKFVYFFVALFFLSA